MPGPVPCPSAPHFLPPAVNLSARRYALLAPPLVAATTSLEHRPPPSVSPSTSVSAAARDSVPGHAATLSVRHTQSVARRPIQRIGAIVRARGPRVARRGAAAGNCPGQLPHEQQLVGQMEGRGGGGWGAVAGEARAKPATGRGGRGRGGRVRVQLHLWFRAAGRGRAQLRGTID